MATRALDLPTEMMNALPDGIVVTDQKGRIQFVSLQLEALAGYSADELVGRPIEALVPPRLRGGHAAHRASYHAAGRPVRPMGSGLQIYLQAKDGSEIPVDISLSPMRVNGREVILAAVRDATERKREQDRQAATIEIAQAILSGQDATAVLALVATRASETARASAATISVPGPGRGQLVRLVAVGKPVKAADAAPAFEVPMVAGGRTFGKLSVTRSPGLPPFGDAEKRIVEFFAGQASVAMEYGRLREEVSRLAVVADRERIGKELHDGVIQAIFAVGMNLQATANMAGRSEVRDRIENSITELDGAIRDLRNYIFGLRPGILADRQLGQAIAQLAADLEAKAELVVAVDVDPGVAARLAGIAGDVVQLVREALSNVARHAQATTCRVTLREDGGDAVIEVDDDGRGFDARQPGGGLGLRNLRDRAASLGGKLEIESQAGTGTLVRIRIPRERRL